MITRIVYRQMDRHPDGQQDIPYTTSRAYKHSGCIPRNACRLQNIAMPDYQESVTTGQTHTRTDRRTDGLTDR